jgi:hypothetical protein
MLEWMVIGRRRATTSDLGAAAPDQFVSIGGDQLVQQLGTQALTAAPSNGPDLTRQFMASSASV